MSAHRSRALHLLGTGRQARRDAALVRLTTAQANFDGAYTACQQAHAQLLQAQQSRADLLARCALGAQAALRESLLPACDALLHQRQGQFAQQQQVLRQAYENLNNCKKAVAHCEKALLRLEQWTALEQKGERRLQGQREEQQAEELVRAQPGAAQPVQKSRVN